MPVQGDGAEVRGLSEAVRGATASWDVIAAASVSTFDSAQFGTSCKIL